MDTLIERLEHILQKYDLSASKLADLLEVQRSGISHILAGRNKPSYDFMVRLAEKFPEIDANWLLSGSGQMLKDDPPVEANVPKKAAEKPKVNPVSYPEIPGLFDAPPSSRSSTLAPEIAAREENEPVYKSKQDIPEAVGGEMEAVIILYRDGTFKRYKPL